MYQLFRKSWEKNWPEIHAGVKGGLPSFIFRRFPENLGVEVPAFCYHNVTANDLEADLKFLSQNGYLAIDADTLLDHLEAKKRAPKNSLALTFDDGAQNLYNVVFPLLKKYNMKAVAFIAPQFHQDDTDGLVSRLQKKQFIPLRWSQIKEMHASALVDFQSHTYAHRYLPKWPEPVKLEGSFGYTECGSEGHCLNVAEDFIISKAVLEQKLNKRIKHLAFPKFIGTSDAIRIGRECGYKGFWWGVLPHRPLNGFGQSPDYIVRIKNEFLRRLPGENRISLIQVIRNRLKAKNSKRYIRKTI